LLACSTGLEQTTRRWLKPYTTPPPAALPDHKEQQRKRPFIYVYDLPPAYNSRMLQYRLGKQSCSWRVWESDNTTYMHFDTYGVETLFHETLLQSPHR
jgi:hypothetical protein